MRFGLDRLLQDPALRAPLAGRRIALLAHPASVTETLDHALDVLAALPDSPNLQLRKAGELEHRGDVDGAIALYEALYEANSDSPLLANNLASLLASARTDAASLTRAEVIARRLRGTEVPAFQDTYGWIATRIGNPDEALRYLEPASARLPDDLAVGYHLAMTYAALGREAEALALLQKLAGRIDPARPPAFAAQLNTELDRLEKLAGAGK